MNDVYLSLFGAMINQAINDVITHKSCEERRMLGGYVRCEHEAGTAKAFLFKKSGGMEKIGASLEGINMDYVRKKAKEAIQAGKIIKIMDI